VPEFPGNPKAVAARAHYLRAIDTHNDRVRLT
jgi:hypothetical protein